MAPLALTGGQLDQVLLIAGPIPPDLHDRYLALVAQLLAGQEIDDGIVYRVARAAAKRVLWDADQREAS